MFRRRGCLFGCGGFLLICVATMFIGWFVAIPRISTVFEESVSDGLSTVIADEIAPLYSRSQLQDGQDVRFSFETINRQMRDENQDSQVESIEITTSGNQIVMRANFNSQNFQVGFMPSVDTDGKLQLEAVDEGGWWQQKVMEILGGGFETSINTWLDQNSLRLTDVTLEGDSIILSVVGN